MTYDDVMQLARLRFLPWVLVGLLVGLSCADDAETTSGTQPTPSGTGTTPPPSSCLPLCFEAGSPDGSAEPFGARAAKQSRAGRVRDASQIVVGPDARQKPAVGDYVLANEHLVVYIENGGFSDGYTRFGGDILAVDKAGDDGRPLGLSRYGETLMGVSKEMIDPESVTVLNDGTDGKAAVVRVIGTLKPVPFLGSLGALFPNAYGLRALYDYILEPGSERLKIRLGLRNDTDEDLDLQYDQMHGFFHYSKNQMVTAESGFAEPKGKVAFAGFDGGDWGFAWRLPDQPLTYSLSISGFQYYVGANSKPLPAHQDRFFDHAELIAGGPSYDGLREAIRRVDGAPAWREVRGTVTEGPGGAVVADAYVHLLDAEGNYLSRARTDAQGAYVIHAPPGVSSQLVASKQGYSRLAPVSAGDSPVALAVGAAGRIEVTATDSANGDALPVRVQVIPEKPESDPSEVWGEERPADGRLHVDYAVTGSTTLAAPPGKHRVIVSRGYEWELLDQTVTVTAGQTVKLDAKLAHSVDSTGVMCADYHIHSFQSADSRDPVVHKVKGAIADGLDIPVSSEHEWVVDFQPVIEQLGLQKWAFGMPSEELTTFAWGHFGVVPLRPRDERVNRGAIDWVGQQPPAFFKAVHEQDDKPMLIINHPSGGTAFSAYFEAALFDRTQGKGKKAELWSDNFDAIEVFNDSDFEANRGESVADWFAMLNQGQKKWAVGSSDSHALRTSPAGYPRSCLVFGHDDPQKLSPEGVRDATLTGNVTISGGLFMTVRGPGGEGPGQTLTVGDAETTLSVDVQAPSWISAPSPLEVIVNGQTVASAPLTAVTGSSTRWHADVKVKRDTTRTINWVVLHAKSDGDLQPLHPGRRAFAVSNPIFLQ